MKRIYLCGPTVYASPHIGNMRPIITFDIFNRALTSLETKFYFVHNITDIDDKIIDVATKQNLTEKEVAKKYEKIYHNLLADFNVIKPHKMPRVTENIEQIIRFIEKLIESSHAYVSGGSVFFAVNSIKNYGQIANRSLSLKSSFMPKTDKRNENDFAVWKHTKSGVTFDSPWGKGRPGWHTECAVFINDSFKGETIDIHGGGIDLIFPHHTNEDAQYIAHNGVRITKEWKHTGQLSVEGVKISKSLNNVIDAKEYIIQNGADSLRMLFLTSSVTKPIEISDLLILQSKKMATRFEHSFRKALFFTFGKKIPKSTTGKKVATILLEWNFPLAFKEIDHALRNFNKEETFENAQIIIELFTLVGFTFTIKKLTKDDFALITKWQELKKQKHYAEADDLRYELQRKKLI